MDSLTRLTIGTLVAATVGLVSSPLGHADHNDPLTPLTPGETQYLDQLHKVFAAKHDPVAFRSDGELLTLGEFACDKAKAGQIGQGATFQTPAVTQLALIYLCP